MKSKLIGTQSGNYLNSIGIQIENIITYPAGTQTEDIFTSFVENQRYFCSSMELIETATQTDL